MREAAFNADVDGVAVAVSASSDGVHIETGGTMMTPDPATADAIASAIHVAAAQVRAARGVCELAKFISCAFSDGKQAAIVDDRGYMTSIARADVPRLITELGAWLAAHPMEAK